VFGLDLFTLNHLVGFIAMTLFTGAAAAAFGIVLATLCRSRAQLGGMSTIIILIMSALGGSMVPRFVMPAFMNDVAKFTFNGWALDGYLRVFWHEKEDAGLVESLIWITPQLAVLAGMTVAFLLIARLVARRWETA
jgi:ABC-2 type transport system permease protein